MLPSSGIVLLRGLLLLGLAISLAVALGQRVIAERGDLASVETSGGDDPGTRVLLLDRSNDSSPTRPQVASFVLQDALLYAPDAADDFRAEISGGTRLTILPNIQDGLIITAPNLPESLAWPVRRVRLVPMRPSRVRGLQMDGDLADILGAMASRNDIEAANRRPLFMVGSRRYRGCLEIAWTGPKSVAAVNCLPVETYLEGVLQAEMAASWPLEALKAQAIASRGYAYGKMLSGGDRIGSGDGLVAFDLRDSVADQEYRGTGSGGPGIDWAINDTRGLVPTVGGVPFAPFFHASSGGRSASVANVFPRARGSDGLARLDGVMPAQDDPYCREGVERLGWLGTHWKHEIVLESGTLRSLLRQQDEAVGWIQDMTVERSPSGRIASVTLRWFGGSKTLTGHQFRMLIGPSKLRSLNWSPNSPVKDDNDFTITTYGWGHGVGMSQVSAYAMAAIHTMDYREILEKSYSGAELVRLWR